MFYRRIFGINRVIWICLMLSCCWCFGSMVAALCAPQPVSYFWSELIDPQSGRYRYNFYWYYIGNAASNVVTDVLILVAPMPVVWKLQMRTGQKIGVCSLLLLGGLYVPISPTLRSILIQFSVCVASIVRIHYLTFLNGNVDLTWTLSEVSFWSTVEPCIGIICACLPALQPFIRSIVRKLYCHHRIGRQSAGTRSQYRIHRHTHSGQNGGHDTWHGQGHSGNMGLRTFFRGEDDQMRLTSVTTQVGMEHPKECDSVEYLDPMAIRVKQVVHWSSG